jgi:DNA-binding NtrC family response regulator
LVARAAASEVPVLLTGETGSGKGVVAREIHRLSRRAAGPLQLVTCPAIPKDLAEAELFGHEKGAFTGAVSARKGRIEAADGGTLFLDEIGDLQLAIQPKLLEVLQTGTFSRVGGTEARSSDFRLISATNVSLRAAVEAKTFREDLLFRINLFEIRLPALRERPEDLPLLCRAILDRFEPPADRGSWEISPALHEWLAGYHWPGNIRQLENGFGRMTLVASGGVLGVDDLPMESVSGDSGGVSGDELRTALVRGQALEDIERAALIAALENSGGNRKRAARILGVSLRTVYNMIDRFGLPKRGVDGKTAE